MDKKVDELSKTQKNKSISKQIKKGVDEQKGKVTTLKEIIEQGYLEEHEGLHE